MSSSSKHPLLSIVVPTYNERENIPILLERLEKALERYKGLYEVIIVDDNSPDGTWALAEKLARERYPWLRVVRRINERGLASAILRGFREAKGEYIVVMDADLQHPPEKIPELLETALREKADLVIASRYVPGGGVEGWSFYRRMVSKVATLIAHLLLPETRKVKDPMSGFWLVRKEVVERLNHTPRSWKVLLDIIVRCRPSRIVEVPYIFKERLYGRSKLGFKHMIAYLKHVLELSEYRIIKFPLVGASGTVVNLATLALLKNLGVQLPIAYAVSFEVSLTWNYMLHDIWTFRGLRPRGARYKLLYWLKYHKAALAGFVSYYSISLLLALVFNVHYLLAGFIGILAGFITNFLISQHHVWKPMYADRVEVRASEGTG